MNEKKQITAGLIWLWIMGAFGIISTSYRTVMLLSNTVRGGDWVMGIVALIVLDIGLIGWITFSSNGAMGDVQRYIAGSMVIVNLLGIGLSLFGDTLYNLNKGVQTDITFWATLGVVAIIFINVCAISAIHFFDPAQELKRAKQKAKDHIDKEVIKRVNDGANEVAGDIAEALKQEWKKRAIFEYTSPKSLPTPQQPPLREVTRSTVTAAADGAVSMNFEAPTMPDFTEPLNPLKPTRKAQGQK